MPNTARLELTWLAAARIVAVYSYPAHAVYRPTSCQEKTYRILRHLQNLRATADTERIRAPKLQSSCGALGVRANRRQGVL